MARCHHCEQDYPDPQVCAWIGIWFSFGCQLAPMTNRALMLCPDCAKLWGKLVAEFAHAALVIVGPERN